MKGSTGSAEVARERLLAEMRAMKDASKLSFGRLAERTHYSRSSWERFLNGKQLPTRVAVEQFAAAVGEDPAPLLEIWDSLAETSHEGTETPRDERPATDTTGTTGTTGAGEAVSGEVGGAPGTSPGFGHRRQLSLLSGKRWLPRLLPVCYVVFGAVLGACGTALLMDGGQQQHVVTVAAPKPECRGDSCLEAEPQAEHCQWDARTVRETWLRGLKVQLRYSPSCKAVWGRVENGTVGDTVSITDRWGRTEDAAIRVGTDTYTRMLSTAGTPATNITLCGGIPSQRDQECTPTDKPPAP